MTIKDTVKIMTVSILTLFFLPTLSAVIWSSFFDSMDARLLIQSPFLSIENAAIVTTHGLFGLSIGAWIYLIFFDQINQALKNHKREAKKAARKILRTAAAKEHEAYDLLESARIENERAEVRLIEAQKQNEQVEVKLLEAQKKCDIATQKGMKAAKSMIDKKVQNITKECDEKLKEKDKQYSESQSFIKQQRDTHNRLYESLQAEKQKRKVLFNILQGLSENLDKGESIDVIDLRSIRKQMSESARQAVEKSKDKRVAHGDRKNASRKIKGVPG